MLALKAIVLILIILGATATTSVAYVVNPQPFEVAKWQALNMVGLATTTTYYVCTYVTPNTSGGTFTITETLGVTQIVGDGGRAAVKTDGTVYYISPYTMPSGYKFQSWSSQRSVSIASASSSTTTVTFGASGWDGWCLGGLAINLVPSTSTYAFTVSAGSGGTVSGKPSGSYAAGTAISVTATASGIGYTFSSWSISGASCSGGASANPCSFSMPSNGVSLTANFSPVVPPSACQNVNTGEGAKIRDPTGKVYIIQGGQKHWIRTENILNILGMALNLCYGGWANVQDVSQACADSVPTGADATDCTPPPPVYYSLTVSAGSGGTVSGTASGSYAAGTSVSVTASPSSGYVFSSWSISGASCSGGTTGNPCAFSMPANAVTLTASFNVVSTKYSLTVSASTGGTVSGTASGSYAAGTSVSVTATPSSPSYSFSGWSISGASCTGGASSNPCTFSMPSNAVSLTANFAASTQYYVCAYVTPNNIGGTFTISGVGTVADGGRVAVAIGTAYPIGPTTVPSNYKFGSWSTQRSVTVASPTSASTTVTFGSSGWDGYCVGSLVLNLVPSGTSTYSLTVSAGLGGTVSGTASGSYAAGTSISVTASPSSGYKFSSWSISGMSCSGGSSTSPCTFSMPSNAVTVTANFVVIPAGSRYVCTYVVPDYVGAGLVIGGVGTYYGQGYERALIIADGRAYALSATLPSGVTFVRWGTQRSVSVANLNSASTTVSFTESGWDGECVGALQLYVQVAPPEGCSTLPMKIYDSGKWEWWISDVEACASYMQHKSEVDLFKPYPDSITTWLSNNLGQMETFPKVSLKLTPPGGAIYASGTEIGIPTDAFYGDYQGIHSGYAYVLIAHETMNLYTGNAVSGGWPYDWWADGRSPFPLTTGMKACIDLNWRDSKAVCQIHLNNYAQQDSLVAMFQSLYMGYGNGMFSRAFSAAKSDSINWENIGANPSALRTNYVTAYLTIGAGGDLTSMFSGKVPNFDPTVTMNIKQARTNLQFIPRSDSRWTEYLRGNYVPALAPTIVANFAYKSAGQPDWTAASQGDSIKVVSPTEFKVTIIQGQVYGIRVVVDGSPYTMTTSGSNTYLATLNLSSASHVIRFEYQGSSGGSWGPLGLLDTQSQETGLAGMFTAFVALVLGNWLVSSGLMLVLLAVAIVIVWRRRH